MDFLEQASYPNSTSVHEALQKISKSSAGVLVLMHHAETSASLLTRAAAKPEAHHAQWDPRSYGIGAQILRDLNVGKMCLLATPRKIPSMAGFGLEVVGYCQAKQ
jgi:3,4-dihydroxy 2-butanone 4-phosphate synthase/GTP cyclohydrolase II